MNPAEYLLDLANGNINDVSVPSKLQDKVQMENSENKTRNGKPSPAVVHERWTRLLPPPVVREPGWGRWPRQKIRLNFGPWRCYTLVDDYMVERYLRKCHARLTDRDYQRLCGLTGQEYQDMVVYLAF